jgi:hypothetical protein
MGVVPPDWLVRLLRQHTIVDELLVSAYIADDEPDRVVIFGKDAFLGSDAGYLMMTLANGDGSLQLSGAGRPHLHEELDLTDIRPLFVSLASNFLSTYVDVRCRTVTLFLNAESNPETGLVRAVEFHLSTGSVFFDPLHWDGIRIGDGATAHAFRAENPDMETVEIALS